MYGRLWRLPPRLPVDSLIVLSVLLFNLLARLVEFDFFKSVKVLDGGATELVVALKMRRSLYEATLVRVLQIVASRPTLLTLLSYRFQFDVLPLGRQRRVQAVDLSSWGCRASVISLGRLLVA